MQNRRRIIIVAGSVVAACALVLAGLLVFRPRPAPVSPVTPVSPVAQQLVSPFTGEPVKSLGPVLAVKIDNIVNARPQTGLGQADIVYVLPVEGGLSRFCADLLLARPAGRRPGPQRARRRPAADPPVRPARVRVLGSAAPAAAGGGAGPHRRSLRRAGRRLLPGQPRVAPYNLYARTSQLLAEAHGASTARDIGFRFGPAPAGGTVTASRSVAYPAASFTFRWSPRKGRWLVWMDGAPATAGPAAGGPAGSGPRAAASWARPPW